MSETIKIAIDGPAGSGKSTLAKALSASLGYVYVDTGAIYRTVGLYAAISGISPDDEVTLSSRFDDIKINLEWKTDGQHIYLNGNDVSDKIRTPEASMYASAVSALPSVRGFLLQMQREIADRENVIMDGRDIGTVILPDAQVKIFMKADPEVRAKRRFTELMQKGKTVTYQEVYDDMVLRDKNDSTRLTAPCVPADDAVIFDNSEFDESQTLSHALSIVKERLK